MRVYKTIEKESKVIGMTFSELSVVLGVAFAGMIIIGIFNLGIYAYLTVMLITVAMFFISRWANKNKCPNFLLSYMSYKLFQPKRINPSCPLLRKSMKK